MPPPSNPVSFAISCTTPPKPAILSYSNTELASLALTTNPPPTKPPLPSVFLAALRVRIPVFVHEQHCSPEGEIDPDDATSWHFVAHVNNGQGSQTPACTLRIVPPSSVPIPVGDRQKDEQGRFSEPYHGATKKWDGCEPYIKIGRMCTLKECRGRGLAAKLLAAAFNQVGAHKGGILSVFRGEEVKGGERRWNGLVLSHAQVAVKAWWEKMGFVEDEEMGRFWEEGMEHSAMWRRLP